MSDRIIEVTFNGWTEENPTDTPIVTNITLPDTIVTHTQIENYVREQVEGPGRYVISWKVKD